ncbi:MAG: biotin carboxylase [Gammaproteobacteria bacterium]|nr:biotin carboxylase [Gammaproteobacteria bacterium]MDH3450711.1 biotin carboxylase [Gammaproteobacteria bacterium]
MARSAKIRGLSDILTFFRRNETPIFFVSPTAFNLLGLEKFVNRFYHINYFDSFDGHHPRVFVPSEKSHAEFESMEDVCNYMLQHKEVIDRIKKAGNGPARLLFVMLDEKTEEICKELGVQVALPPVALRKRLDSKIELTRLASEAGIDSAPNILVDKVDSFVELMDAAKKAQLGNDLVVQTPYGDSGRTTFFIKAESDYDKYAKDMKGEKLKIMKRINHMPGTMEVCVTRHGTLSGPIQTDITGYAEITPYKGGWCGNDVWPKIFNDKIRRQLRNMASALGDRMFKEGYKGVFCMDFLLDTDDGTPYLGEVNPRISGASPLTNLITAHYGGVPLFLFHLLEYLDVDYEVNLRKIQNRWNEYDYWTQLVLKQTEDKVRLLTHAPRSGVWSMDNHGAITFDRPDLDWTNVIDNDEAYYLRVYREGDYTYKGADLGIIVSRGRMQTEKRELLERAKLWTAAINAEFHGAEPKALPEIYQDPYRSKLF